MSEVAGGCRAGSLPPGDGGGAYWSEDWRALAESRPEFFAAYGSLAAASWRNGPLPAKAKALICIALDAATTHLFEPGVLFHIESAKRLGATQDEVFEVLQLASVLGVHSMLMGMPVLLDELRKAGRSDEIEGAPLTEKQQQLKREFEEKRGYWSDLWSCVLQVDPGFFEAYLEFSSAPWTRGVLSPKLKELIYIAIDVSTTHLYEPGLRLHIRNALGYGATAAEIIEVFELASLLGIHTVAQGAPALTAAFAADSAGGASTGARNGARG